MKGDEVEIGQVAAVQELGKAVVIEMNVSESRRLRQRPGTDDMTGIEVSGVKLDVRVRGREKIGREALAATEFAIGERRRCEIGRLDALQQGQEAKEARRQLLIEAISVIDVDDVAR